MEKKREKRTEKKKQESLKESEIKDSESLSLVAHVVQLLIPISDHVQYHKNQFIYNYTIYFLDANQVSKFNNQ